MTEQEALDYAWEFMQKQGEPSMGHDQDGGETCMYTGLYGLHCNIGLFYAEGEQPQSIEGQGITSLDDDGNLPESLKGLPIEFLGHFQGCHDRAAYRNRFIYELSIEFTQFAKRFNLDFKGVTA